MLFLGTGENPCLSAAKTPNPGQVIQRFWHRLSTQARAMRCGTPTWRRPALVTRVTTGDLQQLTHL